MGKYLLQTLYLKPKWERKYNKNTNRMEFNKLADDVLIEVIKDDETNTSEIKLIERPTIEFYTVKDESSCKPYNEMYISRDLVDAREVEYSKRDLEIVKYLGIEEEYNRLRNEANRYYSDWTMGQKARQRFREFVNEKVYKSPYIYGANIGIEEYYKTKFMLEHGETPPKILNISFFDIETYIYHFKTQVDQNNPLAPINIITYFNNKTMEYYALILEIDEIPAIQEVKNNQQQFLDEYISEDFEKYPEIKIHLEFYKDEVILIRRFMNLIHRDKPDFALAWNSNYDIKYIIGRMEKHGLDINKEWCHPDIPDKYKQFRFIEDAQRLKKSNSNEKDKKKDFSRLWDKVLCPGYTVFLDQMSLYSNLRKRYIEHSYKLDYIAEKVVGANKVDLHEFGLNIRNAPFKDFKRFLKYSIRDTFLLWLIEVADDDLTDYNLLCENTDVWNGVNVSIKIKNIEYMMMVRDRNEVMGNTIDYGVDEHIDGALVQEPSLVDAECVEMNGKRTKLYEAIADFDAESLYPSLMLQGKIGKENNRYRITSIVDHDNGDKFLMSGQEFNQLLQTKSVSIIDICNTLYGLPKVEDVLTNIQQTLIDKGEKSSDRL